MAEGKKRTNRKAMKTFPFPRAMVLREAGSSVENWTLVEVTGHVQPPFVPCGDSAATAAATAPTTHTLLAPTPHALSPIF